MKFLKLFFFIIVFFTTGAYCYVINGKVIDERYFPVPGIQINVSGGISATTDINGAFSVSTSEMPYNLLVLDAALSLIHI